MYSGLIYSENYLRVNANFAELYNYELFKVKNYQPNHIILYTGAHG